MALLSGARLEVRGLPVALGSRATSAVHLPIAFSLLLGVYLMTTLIEPEASSPAPTVTIQVATPSALPALCNLYPNAFPKENLLPLIHDLQGVGPPSVLSLIAINAGETQIVGSIFFTFCTVVDDNNDDTKYESAVSTTQRRQPVALLGPLCVHPSHQNQGIGSALIKNGVERMQQQAQLKALLILVLGSPKYYSRFGFQRETNIITPYPLRSESASAWQSMDLNELEGKKKVRGRLAVPSPWQHENLWS
jgi:putative acetyltransferase